MSHSKLERVTVLNLPTVLYMQPSIMTEHLLKASCYCGDFKIEVPVLKSSLPLNAAICHCNRCRWSSGGLCSTYLRLEGYIPEAPVLSRLVAYKTSEKASRYFCPRCSCHVLLLGDSSDEQRCYVATGCLDHLEGNVEFTRHMYIKDTLDGGFSDWLTECAGVPMERNATSTGNLELELGWHDTEILPASESPGRLQAQCDCSKVKFYLSRPSPSPEQMSAPWPDVLVPHNSGPANLHENEIWWLRADKQKFLGGICACNSCRLMHGFEWIEWAFIPTSDISLDRDGKVPFSREFGTLKAFRSSDNATKRFCAECGATVFWDGDVRPGLIDVAVGLLHASEGARAESWLE